MLVAVPWTRADLLHCCSPDCARRQGDHIRHWRNFAQGWSQHEGGESLSSLSLEEMLRLCPEKDEGRHGRSSDDVECSSRDRHPQDSRQPLPLHPPHGEHALGQGDQARRHCHRSQRRYDRGRQHCGSLIPPQLDLVADLLALSQDAESVHSLSQSNPKTRADLFQSAEADSSLPTRSSTPPRSSSPRPSSMSPLSPAR